MKLGASTCIMGLTDGIKSYDLEDCFEVMKKAGYGEAAVDFWQQGENGFPFAGDHWEEWAYMYANKAKLHGISVYQTHAFTLQGMYWDDMEYSGRERALMLMHRSIDASMIFGAKWVVVHPYNLPHSPLYDRKKLMDACISYLAPYIEHAKRRGIGLAVENMVDFKGGRRRYCAGDITELCELVDTINDPSVGICLDTGHANIGGAEVSAAVRLIGKRLRATHIHDNNSKFDEHILPYMGLIDWKGVMQALGDIGYDGEFTFELGPKNIPDSLRQDFVNYTYSLGNSLLKLAHR